MVLRFARRGTSSQPVDDHRPRHVSPVLTYIWAAAARPASGG
jgi:hypothetical protein